MALKRFAGSRPVWFGIAVTLLSTVLQIVAGIVAYGIQDPVMRSLVATLIRGLGAVLWFVLLARLRWLGAAGISRLGEWRLWVLVLVLLVYDVGLHMWAFFGDLSLRIEDAALAGATALSHLIDGGLTQELVFRGLVLCALVQAWGCSRRSLVKSALISSLIFGLMHVVNLIVVIVSGDKSAAMVGMQVISTLLSGVTYAGLVLYGGTFWPAALLHAALNVTINVRAIATPGFEETMAAWMTIVLAQLPLVVLGFYMLWRAGVENEPIEAELQGAVVTG